MLASPRESTLTVVVAIALVLAVLAESSSAAAPGRNGPMAFRCQQSRRRLRYTR
jgi:hypothetical protein